MFVESRRLPVFTFALGVYAVLCTIFILSSLLTGHGQTSSRISELHQAYRPVVFVNGGSPNTTYAGPPSLERDSAWRRFMLPDGLRFSREELHNDGQASIPLPGGGFLGRLGVYHEIHCLAFLRQWNYHFHYYSGLDVLGVQLGTAHADHCIELLRQAAMCHADTSIQTFKWGQDSDTPQFDAASPAVHMCVDWEMMQKSLQSRVVPRKEMKSLIRPSS